MPLSPATPSWTSSPASGTTLTRIVLGCRTPLGSFGRSGTMVSDVPAGVIRRLAAIDHILCDMLPFDLVDLHPVAFAVGRITDPHAVSDHCPVVLRFPRLGGRPSGHRGWPTWLMDTDDCKAEVGGPDIDEARLKGIVYAKGMLQAACS